MPVFLVWGLWLVAGAVAGFGGYLVLASLKGKRFVVLGPSLAGKTTLIGFLKTGEVTLQYEATVRPAKLNGRKIKLQEHELKIDSFDDVPGTKDFHSAWEKKVSAADVVCYLFDGKRFVDGDTEYIDQVTAEMRHVSDWRRERAIDHPALRFFVIATHLDQVTEYRASDAARRRQYIVSLWKTRPLAKLALVAGGAKARCLGGSLADREGSEALMTQIISEVAAAE